MAIRFDVGDCSIPFFQRSVACATQFHTRHDAFGYRFAWFHLPVVSFFSYLNSILPDPFGFSVDNLNWLSQCPNYWALQPL